ncbi:hypothetical protein [Lutibacter maritimus]|uniref:Uncharacterized protein n=1 Tax=Lutibacter maritimus TaxID=593133 RepID=A0A1I6T0E9_9FLAO|nr:hypothetical protein [Lutibacter maritimus]SFS82632.1 hypothetical protein SAMN04488006_0918 [Lutibacter maritimus]
MITLFSQVLVGQNNCGDFKDYNDSQKWIKELKQLKSNEIKTKIIERIECEQKSEPNDIDFWLTILFDGIIVSTANEIPIERNSILKLISSDNFNIGQSLCEVDGIYPEKCNLGFVMINGLEKPILNEIVELKNIRLKRKKGKIIIKLDSEIKNSIEFKVVDFLKIESTKLVLKSKLKKGNNRIVIKRSNNLQYIEANLNGNKLIILI